MDKGPINGSHVLLLPIEHFVSSLACSPNAWAEMQRYLSALKACAASQVQVACIVAEVMLCCAAPCCAVLCCALCTAVHNLLWSACAVPHAIMVQLVQGVPVQTVLDAHAVACQRISPAQPITCTVSHNSSISSCCELERPLRLNAQVDWAAMQKALALVQSIQSHLCCQNVFVIAA